MAPTGLEACCENGNEDGNDPACRRARRSQGGQGAEGRGAEAAEEDHRRLLRRRMGTARLLRRKVKGRSCILLYRRCIGVATTRPHGLGSQALKSLLKSKYGFSQEVADRKFPLFAYTRALDAFTREFPNPER